MNSCAFQGQGVTIYLATQLSASALSIAGTYFYGNKTMAGPMLGIAAQVPWWLLMYQGSLWGLLPVNAVMLVVHARNLWKWSRQS
jgi:hypothetical protein